MQSTLRGSRLRFAVCFAMLASLPLTAACVTTEPPADVSDDDEDTQQEEDTASGADDDSNPKGDDEGDGKSGGKPDGGSTADPEKPDTKGEPEKPDTTKGDDSKPESKADASAPDKGKDAGQEPAKEPKSGWCEVLTIFRESCQSCHGATLAAGAPMPLLTYADAIADAPVTEGKKVYDVVKSRVHAVKNPMPPGRPLSAEKLAAIDAWVAAGASDGGDPTCADLAEPEKPRDRPWPPEGCEETYKILAGGNGKKASVPPGVETHPQFVSDAPWGNADVQLIASRPITDNAKVLHHWILYAQGGSRAHIRGWAPGADDTDQKPLPADVGVFLPKGPGSLRLDMHYNNVTGTQSEEDASGVEVCVTKNLRKHSATTFSGFAAIPTIPPKTEMDVVGTCTVSVRQPVFLLSESPHAHTLATHMKLYVRRNGMDIKLHDGPFAFDGQVATYFDEPFELKTGDVVTTTCHYNNDTNKRVTFGEDTGDEMCFNFVTYYPMGALSCSRSSGGLGGLGGF